MMIAKV